MSDLDDFLVLQSRESLSGQALESPIRPSAVGLKRIDAPNGLSNGLLYRVNGSSLETIKVEGSVRVISNSSLSSEACHIKASHDGRMVAVACIDGSLQCYDSTASGLSLRWSLADVHSHVSTSLDAPVSGDRSNAACASGPLLALDFSKDYALVLVDATKGMAIYDARASEPTNKLSQQHQLIQNVSSATWRHNSDEKESLIAIGRYDGSVAFFRYANDAPSEPLGGVSECGRPSEEDGFVCTHLNWNMNTLVAGLCRVECDDDEEPDEDDEDDIADHEANLFVTTIDGSSRVTEWSEQGDVVPFFAVPKHGKHVFFTSFLGASKLIAVATNVGTDIGSLSANDSTWQPVEFQEGAAASTPTNDDDEFCFPLGICIVQLSDASFRLVLASTDGSLSTFEFEHTNDPSFFSGPAIGSSLDIPDDPIETIAASEKNSWVVVDETRDPPKTESPPSTPSVQANSAFSFGTTSVFGSGSKAPVFGTSAFGSSSSGNPKTTSPFAAFSKPGESSSVFGTTSSLGGSAFAPSFGATSPLGGLSGTPSEPTTSKPTTTFGSKSTFGTTFGAGTTAVASGGFAALSSSSNTGFGFGGSSAFPSSSTATTFGTATAKTEPSGDPTTKESKPDDSELNDTEKSAAKVYDEIDSEKSGKLHVAKFEELSEALGEGFHGDEYDAQLAIVDPTESGWISRANFIQWYKSLVEGGSDDDNDSLDTEERAERDEEREKMLSSFQELSQEDKAIGKSFIVPDQFGKLIESLGSVYCEEEHGKTIKKLTKGDGRIYEADVVEWYIDWLFGDGDEDSDAESQVEASPKPDSDSNQKSLGDIFKVDETEWKCEVCSIRNKDTLNQCKACETPRPGFEGKATKNGTDKPFSESNASIGPGGFSFGGGSSSIGAGGFTFGGSAAKPSTVDATSSIGSGGFTFGGGAAKPSKVDATSSIGSAFGGSAAKPSTVDATSSIGTGGFTFGGSRKTSGPSTSSIGAGGFTFVAPTSTKAPEESKSDTPKALSDTEKTAWKVFQKFDSNDSGSVDLSCFEEMLESLGEGFHGDEYDAQVALVDPSKTGKISSQNFTSWYRSLVEGHGEDDDSLDTADRKEREEERQSAKEAFGTQCKNDENGKPYILPNQFSKVIEALGSVYCEEEHKKTLKKLKSANDRIYESDFLIWYVDWLFGDGDESEDEEDSERSEGVTENGGQSEGKSLGDIFKVDETQWKCEVCSIRNKDTLHQCKACETPRPGFEDKKTGNDGSSCKSSLPSSSSIGSGGFTFGGAVTGKATSSSIGAGGFTFGATTAPVPTVGGSSSIGAGGFTFGGATKTNTSSGGGSSSIGAGGFTFAAPSKETKTPGPTVGTIRTLTSSEKTAARVFDEADSASTGVLDVSIFEELLESLGEGFHGDEYEAQVALVDPSKSGKIKKAAFLAWYKSLVEGGTDDDSLDTADRKEQEEERKAAAAAFAQLSKNEDGKSYIVVSQFGELIETLGSIYCEEEHVKTIRKLRTEDERIYETTFLEWYIEWLFGEEDSDDENEGDGPATKDEKDDGKLSSLGDIFKVDETEWKCDVCSIRNKDNQNQCKACETPRPGFEGKSIIPRTASSNEEKATSSSIGPGGFSFGGASTTTSSIGAGGFSFGGATATKPSIKSTESDGTEKSPFAAFSTSSTTSSSPFASFGARGKTADIKESTSSTVFPPTSSTATASAKGSLSAAFPPMPAKAATNPFATKPVATTKSSSSAAFPPMSSKAPTPFGSGTTSRTASAKTAAKAPSAAAFPPMSSKAPTPFGAKPAAQKTASPAFPPMSAKTPSPFGAKPAAKAPASGAFPPMSAKAPTPFGAKPAAKAPASPAFPPMSSKAPTPFGAKPVAKPPSSPAFPPMSAKAPTPFGAKPAAKAPASAAFPPMSAKAPTPFGAKPAAKAPASAAFPPMSAKAPTPFGAKPAAKAPASPAFPPMSAKAPTPFGTTSQSKTSAAFPPMSAKAPTPFGAKPAAKAPASAAFPPMSAKAPTPFGAKPAAKAPASPAFPPMSAKAPTPFGTTSQSKTSASAAFPPMSSKAPTPFGAKPAAKAPASPAFPPMSSKAPTPFGAKPAAKAPASPAFPPMSSKAPTPFGAKPAAKAPSAAAFPPMSSKAPTPFGTTSQSKTSASAAFPPRSNKVSAPFGSSAVATYMSTKTSAAVPAMAAKAPSNSFGKEPSSVGNRSSTLAKPGKTGSQMSDSSIPKTKIQMQLDSVLQSFASTVAHVSTMRSEAGIYESRLRQDIEDVAVGIEKERSKLLNIDTSLSQKRSETAFLLSRKTDSSRQIDSAGKLVRNIKKSNNNNDGVESIAGAQVLDQESERNRRRFAASSRNLVRRIALVEERVSLLEATNNDQEEGQRYILQGVLDLYKSTKTFDEVCSRIESDINLASKKVPFRARRNRGGRSTYSLNSSHFKSPKRHNKLRPIDIEGERQTSSTLRAKSARSIVSRWKDVETSLQKLSNESMKVDRFDTLSIKGTKDEATRDQKQQLVQTRSTSRSLLMSPPGKQNNAAEQALVVANKVSIFSPPSKTNARSGWDQPSSIDTKRMNQLSIEAPRELKQTTLSNASRETLAGFGTTPEKLKASIAVKKNESTELSKPAFTSQSKGMQPKRKTGTSVAFPPLPNKAPSNPFSKSATSAATAKTKDATSSAPLPPMPKQAPKNPFSKPKAAEPASKLVGSEPAGTKVPPFAPAEKTTTVEKKSSSNPFGSMKGLGDSLFSGGATTPSFGALSSAQETKSMESTKSKDYTSILTAFYQKHNASKIGEVAKTLEKYKGREPEMFQKLASKYKVPNPLQDPSFGNVGSIPVAGSPAPVSGFGITTSTSGTSPFSSSSNSGQQKSTIASFGSAAGNSTPFGGTHKHDSSTTSSNVFQTQAPSPSPFGGTSTQSTSSPFGSSPTPAPSFGGTATSSSSPFGTSGGLSSASPFGASAAPTPFGAPSQSPMQTNSQRLFNGKSARDLLYQFYQEKNPSKLAEVDKLLAKYSGKEEQMFRNLAKKYQLDPSVFGISAAAASPAFGSPPPGPGGFGQPSAMGGGANPFGQTSGSGFGQASSLGGGGMSGSKPPGAGTSFGSATANSGFGASGFGSLAQSSNPSPFGGQASGFGAAAASSGFGSSSAPAFGSATPFGAARR